MHTTEIIMGGLDLEIKDIKGVYGIIWLLDMLMVTKFKTFDSNKSIPEFRSCIFVLIKL